MIFFPFPFRHSHQAKKKLGELLLIEIVLVGSRNTYEIMNPLFIMVVFLALSHMDHLFKFVRCWDYFAQGILHEQCDHKMTSSLFQHMNKNYMFPDGLANGIDHPSQGMKKRNRVVLCMFDIVVISSLWLKKIEVGSIQHQKQE